MAFTYTCLASDALRRHAYILQIRKTATSDVTHRRVTLHSGKGRKAHRRHRNFRGPQRRLRTSSASVHHTIFQHHSTTSLSRPYCASGTRNPKTTWNKCIFAAAACAFRIFLHYTICRLVDRCRFYNVPTTFHIMSRWTIVRRIVVVNLSYIHIYLYHDVYVLFLLSSRKARNISK